MGNTARNFLSCPTCGSNKTYSTENQSLWHPADPWNGEPIDDETPQFDTDLYITFQCAENKEKCPSFEVILNVNVPKG